MNAASADAPDLVLTEASAYLPDATPGRPVAVAVSRGRISAVGPAGEIRRTAGPRTEVIDLPGAMIVPGFQDAHVHPELGGSARMGCGLHDLRGVEEYRRAIRDYARSHPDVPWILGGGWSLHDFPRGTPRRSVLDAVVPDRPVFLVNRDGHGAWVNSRALEMAGVGRDTPDPTDGRIERDADGSPQGTLHEGAMELVSRIVPAPTPAETEAALLEGQRYLHSLGVTAWQDAWVTRPILEAYRSLAERGALTGRVVAALWWDRHRGPEQVEELVELRRTGMVGRLRPTSVKIMQDGICENFTAGMLEPYLDARGNATANRGLSFVEPDLLREAVGRLDAEGFQVHVHAIGDRAVREALDAFEAAGGGRARRHHIAHVQVVHPQDVPRFGRLGITANGQPFWACLDGQMRDLTIPFLGPDRTALQYPFASLVREGARLAFGSDWPVSTPDPLKEIQVAVTRKPVGESDREAFLPEERLSLREAIHAFTMGSAYVNHLDHDTGSIEVGKLADLAVLDSDPFSVPQEEIGAVRCVMTLVEGEVVHRAD